MRRAALLALIVLLAVGSRPAASQGAAAALADVPALIAQGDFAPAYERAAGSDSAADLVLAARAAAYQAVYREADPAAKQAWLERAAAAASSAVELDPGSAAAYMEVARAEGLLAQFRGVLANLDTAPRLRKLFDTVLELEPEDPDALAALAQWHLELAERGVAWLYGGDRRQVDPLFARALAAAPERVNLRVEYATALRRLGRPEDAREQLEAALALPAPTAVDRFEQDRARRLLEE